MLKTAYPCACKGYSPERVALQAECRLSISVAGGHNLTLGWILNRGRCCNGLPILQIQSRYHDHIQKRRGDYPTKNDNSHRLLNLLPGSPFPRASGRSPIPVTSAVINM